MDSSSKRKNEDDAETMSKEIETEYTLEQLSARQRICEMLSTKVDPAGAPLAELRELQDSLAGVFHDDGWKRGHIMLIYPFNV